MPLTRIVRTGLLAALSAVAVGCAPPPPSSGSGVKRPNAEAAPKTDAFINLARSFAIDFLKAVKAGKGDPAQLSAAFKKVYAPAEFEADKANGYSDAAAAQLLKLAATEVGDDLTIVTSDGRTALFVAKGKTGERTLVRVTDDGGMKIDWLGVAPKSLPDSPFPKGEGDAAQFTAMAFLDAALTRKFHLAEGLLSDAAKSTYGKSVFGGAFDRGALKSKLEELFGEATQYTVKSAAKEAVTAELPVAGGKKTATFKLAGGSPAQLKVDQIEVK